MPLTSATSTSSRLVATRLRALLVWASRSRRNAMVLLVATSLLAFLPGFFTLPPIDRDEARFAQATKQMVESGDYVDIRFQEESRYKKPVGIYWLQALVVNGAEAIGVREAHTRIWLYRIPSLIGAIAAVLLTWWTALAFVSRRGAVLAGLMMAGSILLGVEARLAKTDAMLLATVVAAMGAMARAYLAERGVRRDDDGHTWTLPAIFWTAMAGGFLIKGPLILMVVGLTVVTLAAVDRSARFLLRLKPLPGLAWMLLLVLPWFVAIVIKSGDSFFAESVGRDLWAKVGSGQESHGAPPGYYLLLFWGTFFPASILVPMAAGAVWRGRRHPAVVYLLAWLVPTWLAFEAAMTKLPHYVLPVYPAVAILLALVIDHRALSTNKWLRRAPMWWFILIAALTIGLIVVNITIGQRLGLITWGLSAAALIVALVAWWLFEADGVEVSLMRAVVASMLISTAAFAATFATIGPLFPSLQLARFVAFGQCERPAVATAGFHEPSLVFLVGTQVQHVTGPGAADFLAAGDGRCRYAFVDSRHERAFAQRAEALGLRYRSGLRLEGVNISSGRSVSIAAFVGGLP
ncbi:ArnT family glycosyltransferase [Rhodoplanes serenus]|uniref:ArnT family glycosyltransferase n=1 Tax=Rhodoplanes serenus TaxID=200615 RepID=UPI000DACC99A|nr:glycosyltransferase family 39 protein [Rhodoplanes serenus]RAI34053.1 glycosyl transferase [Rhodoplanes serenus]